jgi:hypothetical protein
MTIFSRLIFETTKWWAQGGPSGEESSGDQKKRARWCVVARGAHATIGAALPELSLRKNNVWQGGLPGIF